MKFKSYQWYNAEFKKKYTKYNYIMIGFMALVLICLFFFPQSLKMMNLAFIAGGVVFWYLGYSIREKDKKLKATVQMKKVAAK